MASTIRVAVLDEQIPAQLRERPAEADGLEVVWSGTDLDALLHYTAKESPNVIVANLDWLGGDPKAASEQLLASSKAELFITVYQFAPRGAVEHLAGQNRRVLKGPVSIPMLKTQMMSTIVRGLLSRDVTTPPTTPPPARPGIVRRPLSGASETPRYDDAQLGTLRERQSSLACECPNHVAELVTSLLAFERYSRACANRDDDDARMHRRLATATGEARRVMEAVLTELLEFEKITV